MLAGLKLGLSGLPGSVGTGSGTHSRHRKRHEKGVSHKVVQCLLLHVLHPLAEALQRQEGTAYNCSSQLVWVTMIDLSHIRDTGLPNNNLSKSTCVLQLTDITVIREQY